MPIFGGEGISIAMGGAHIGLFVEKGERRLTALRSAMLR
jgi:hypothetical protein